MSGNRRSTQSNERTYPARASKWTSSVVLSANFPTKSVAISTMKSTARPSIVVGKFVKNPSFGHRLIMRSLVEFLFFMSPFIFTRSTNANRSLSRIPLHHLASRPRSADVERREKSRCIRSELQFHKSFRHITRTRTFFLCLYCYYFVLYYYSKTSI